MICEKSKLGKHYQQPFRVLFCFFKNKIKSDGAVITLEASHDDTDDDDEAMERQAKHDDVGNPIICRQVHAISTDLSAFKLVFVFRMQATANV